MPTIRGVAVFCALVRQIVMLVRLSPHNTCNLSVMKNLGGTEVMQTALMDHTVVRSYQTLPEARPLGYEGCVGLY